MAEPKASTCVSGPEWVSGLSELPVIGQPGWELIGAQRRQVDEQLDRELAANGGG